MSQPLLEMISERRTCLLARIQKPAIISAKQNEASSGLPSSTEAAPLTGKPKMFSHWERPLEQAITSQMSGSQSAPLTLGLSRMSRRKRKIIKATVRQDAMVGERCIGYIRGQTSEGGGQRSEDRRRTTDDRGWSWSSAMLRQLDYLHRAVIRFLKETADGLNCVSNHLFRHFGKDRQR
jgi:hypothetical protein